MACKLSLLEFDDDAADDDDEAALPLVSVEEGVGGAELNDGADVGNGGIEREPL